jgi:UDP-N-acetylmuramoyl-tripeptide--D-alanyl-D-alanine ligase
MKPIILEQIAHAVGGQTPRPLAAIRSVCTDSRRIERDCLFVALHGERFDGHDYLDQVAKAGALAALVDHLPRQIPQEMDCILVPDTRRAMGLLAQFVRRQFKGKVIGVAGSNGKTGTKHLIDAALKSARRGSISPKSFNNDIGVPITIFAADPADEYLVLEMGTNHHGEIAWLTEIAQPDIAVITNCSAEHLEGLDDLAGVRRENAAIIGGLPPKGLLVVNGDDADLLHAVADHRGEIMTFGFELTNDLYASNVICESHGTRFLLNDRAEVFLPLLGRHSAANALAAIAVGRHLHVSDEQIIAGLAHAKAPEMRLQRKRIAGIDVLDDSYNANPASMRAALDTLSALPAHGRRIAVLGEMRELGRHTEESHRQIGRLAARHPLDALVCVGGEAAGWIMESALAAGMATERLSQYPDAVTAADAISRWLSEGDLILLKASRAIGLERVAIAIAAHTQPAARASVA